MLVPQVLQQVTQRPDEVRHDIASQNSDKNRSKQFLPRKRENNRKWEFAIYSIIITVLLFSSTADNHRVPLKGEHPDYINAVYVNVSNASLVQ